MKTEEEFEIFYIDLNRMEEQVAEHSFLYVHFCKELKDARSVLSQEKSKFDLVAAEESLRIGRKPARYNLPDKPTASMISNTLKTRAKYQEALKEYNAAEDLVSTLQIYVNAFEHRKRMLTQAVKLHGESYFATPYVASSNIKEVVEQLQKRAARSKVKISGKKKMSTEEANKVLDKARQARDIRKKR